MVTAVDPFTVDSVLKAAIGPFFGVLFAFATNWLKTAVDANREQKRATTLALMTVHDQYNSMLECRNRLRREIAGRAESLGDAAAEWMYAPAMAGTLKAASIDFKSLSFIFDGPDGVECYRNLVLADQHHQTLCDLVDRLRETSESIQEALAQQPDPSHDGKSMQEVDAVVPMDRRARARDLLFGLLDETETDEAYVNAFSALRDLAVNRLGPNSVPHGIEAKEPLASEAMPPLPAVLVHRPD